jgi:hypothetical protein
MVRLERVCEWGLVMQPRGVRNIHLPSPQALSYIITAVFGFAAAAGAAADLCRTSSRSSPLGEVSLVRNAIELGVDPNYPQIKIPLVTTHHLVGYERCEPTSSVSHPEGACFPPTSLFICTLTRRLFIAHP